MKKVLFTLLIIISLIACKKNNSDTQPEHEKSIYRVSLIGKSDTTQLPQLTARVETIGLDSAKDGTLRVVLVSYQNIGGNGYYTLQVTNLQSCQMILRWGWDGNLSPTSIQPTDSTANTTQSDVIKGNQTKTYLVIGNPQPGRIKVQAQKSNSGCPNSSELIINITPAILPIKVVQSRADYDKKSNKTTISFTVEDPAFFDWILIDRYIGNNQWEQAALIGADHITKNYSVRL